MKKQVIVHDHDNKKFKVSVDKLTFRPSIYGIIIKNGKVLLSKQWDGYDFPGGGIKLGETVEQALTREVWEETGYRVTREKFIGCFDAFFRLLFSNEDRQFILLYYTCKIKSGKISTANFDKDEKKYAGAAEWIDLKDIDKLKFYNSVDSVKLIKEAAKISKK
ncbi:MAG: NUDIX hydrolase [Patescibacteria group bacterium]